MIQDQTPAEATRCTCGASGAPHSITCLTVAATQPHAMVDPTGDVCYPDDRADALHFHREWGAVPVTPHLWPFGDLTLALPDDPTPTTGIPDPWWEDRPEGCVCYVREDVEYGDVWTVPPGGCPVHSCTCHAICGDHSATCLHTTLNDPDRPGAAEALAQDWRDRYRLNPCPVPELPEAAS